MEKRVKKQKNLKLQRNKLKNLKQQRKIRILLRNNSRLIPNQRVKRKSQNLHLLVLSLQKMS